MRIYSFAMKIRVLKCFLRRSNTVKLFILTLLTVLLVLLVNFHEDIYLEFYSRLFVQKHAVIQPHLRRFGVSAGGVGLLRFESMCAACRPQTVELRKRASDNSYVVSVYNTTRTATKTKMKLASDSQDNQLKEHAGRLRSDTDAAPHMLARQYSLSAEQFESGVFTCGYYNALRRGPNTRVLAYSLYGRNRFYYDSIKTLVRHAKLNYPGWLLRIYYDNSIDPDVICEIECLRDSNADDPAAAAAAASYYDMVDFCNVEQLPYDLRRTWSARYMHGMTWRWLPFGDTFVDFFGSRDTDASISNRERDSAHEWLQSSTLFHVMRDAPVHDIPIVGGYWGFANQRDRALANYFFNVITNRQIARFFNRDGLSPKGHDQFLLTKFMAPYSLRNATTHDSYSCGKFPNSAPFPSRRPATVCFVGCWRCCEDVPEANSTLYQIKCPLECRPKEHPDWFFC